MPFDLDYLKRNFFYFDLPVDYSLGPNSTLKIYPVSVKDSEYFLYSKGILDIDKNSLPDVKIIQMSYLQFVFEYLMKDKENLQKLVNILFLCLHFNKPFFNFDENGKILLIDKELNVVINEKQFDDIRSIILYQNLIDYDDEYINPELKAKLDEAQYLKSRNIVAPSLERKIAIITAHTGIDKKSQLEMTYRSHTLLFQEVYEETEYTTMYPILFMFGNADKTEQWIYKKKKGKFADQTISVSDYNKQAGGLGEVSQKIVNN